ncbi:Alpha/Beta hydrolase protein [Hyaloraphidium curvatum]|nr:Alpha/Beta hydrolase protein [Hyaloraphidium curvatum]
MADFEAIYDAVQTRFATGRDGSRIAFRRLACRSPEKSGLPLILVCGFSTNFSGRLKHEWGDFGFRLLADRDVVVVDNRGLGESVLDAAGLDAITSHEVFADDVLCIAREAGLDRFHLGGVSFGGYVSQNAVFKVYPGTSRSDPSWTSSRLRLAGVALICTAPRRKFDASNQSPWFSLLDAERARVAEDLAAGLITEEEGEARVQRVSWIASLTPEWAAANPEKVDALVRQEAEEVARGTKPAEVLARYRAANGEFDLTPDLRALNSDGPRFLVVHGDRDFLVPHTVGGDLFTEALPDFTYVLLKDVGHSTYLMDDGATADAMCRFFEEVERDLD